MLHFLIVNNDQAMDNKQPLFLTSFFRGIGIPVLLWIAFTPFSSWLDLKLSIFFYENGSFSSNPFWLFVFQYGFVPAWILTFIALGGFLLSFFPLYRMYLPLAKVPLYRKWRNPCLVIVLTFAIGSGLIVHGILKDHWGRPRPKQTMEFGGKQPFRPYYQPNFNPPEPSKSFSCGHCSTGFTFFSLAILGTYYRSRLFWWLGWSLAWGLGLILSLTRMAQGGHFLSDALASALIMWITAWSLAYLLIVKDGTKNERSDT